MKLVRRIGNAVTVRMRKLHTRLDPLVIRLAGRVPGGGLLYALLFSRGMGREARAVLAGRREFLRKNRPGTPHSALLRRNIHRLEKGLLMRPRRDLFGLEYLEETVLLYGAALADDHGDGADPSLRQWAHDILSAYFRTTPSHPVIDAARSRFNGFDPMESSGFVPFKRDLSKDPPVSHAAFDALAARRKSVRWYLAEPVPRDLVETAIRTARKAPSACNRQPFVFHCIDDRDLLNRVIEIPFGTAGFRHNVPFLVVLIGRLDYFIEERDRHLIYIDSALAAMTFTLALETLGLSGCVINWPDIDEKERRMSEILRLKPWERPVLLMAVGRPDPDGMVASSPRKPVSQLVRYNDDH